ncbi:S-adenosyl-L-methionine dependent methyltransferase [Lophiotrema nucula]|uniref:S-adenosyl-L-methionine dependent methyltransferase n=1 Tax=Lophiotrema nucula TaxID=690887 RepID=A0A6A5ZLI4_9PLEO|nr:S-adenosyl-L-methionine dependent methyltransferase [Lophiotrema nucula]
MSSHVFQGLDDPSKPSPSQPVVARMYDWYLGGTHSYEIDRKAAEATQRALPDIKPLVVENRSFLRRAVRYLAKNGYTQFIDIGSGLPTVGNTHEAVLRVNPGARILYVDIEASAVNEGNEFIRKTGWADQVGMIRASALEPENIFNDPETRRVIDFDKPVVILKIALVHFFRPQQ